MIRPATEADLQTILDIYKIIKNVFVTHSFYAKQVNELIYF